MKPCFQTKNFDVYRIETHPTQSLIVPRLVYVATFKEIDWPGQVVTVCLTPDHSGLMGGAYVDWIETSENNRGKGYAMEVLIGIQADMKTSLVIDGTTESGAGLEEAWAQKQEAGGGS